LRRNEARMLDLADLRRAQKTPQYRQFGGLFVRYGKASRGSPPKRRTVLTVPEMDWIIDVLDRWVTDIRPMFSPGSHPALFVTERVGRMSVRGINNAFSAASEAAGLPPELDLHSLRHSYVTHLVEFDYPEKFVSVQVGHEYASTTAIYTGISDEYRARLVRRSLTGRDPELWGRP
jgi:site-specific recombinase XerD